MKSHIVIMALASITILSGSAAAQSVRTQPQAQVQTPNLTIAPASAADLAALQQRVQQLEAAHNTTRTELAQTRLQLQQARAELDATKTNLNALRQAVLTFAVCERQRQGSSAGAEFAWLQCPTSSNTPTSNLGNLYGLQQATDNAY